MKLAAFALVYTTLATLGLVVLRRTLADASLDEVVRSPWLYVGGAFYAGELRDLPPVAAELRSPHGVPALHRDHVRIGGVAAALVLDEQLTAARFAGMAFVAVGAVLLVR